MTHFSKTTPPQQVEFEGNLSNHVSLIQIYGRLCCLPYKMYQNPYRKPGASIRGAFHELVPTIYKLLALGICPWSLPHTIPRLNHCYRSH